MSEGPTRENPMGENPMGENPMGAGSSVEAPWFHVVLIEPEIPPNTGSIGRLCLGTGCRLHLVKPLGFSIDEKAVRRAGLDYWKHVDLEVHEDLASVLALFPPERLVLTSAKAGIPYTQHHFQRGDALFFGRESKGLPRGLVERFPEQLYRIPLFGPIRSLNLSSAASIVVLEGLRQLRPELFYPEHR